MVKQKLKEWIKRYLPGEIVGTATAVGAASVAHIFYKNPILVAYIGSIGESIGFYSTIFIQNINVARNKNRVEKKAVSFYDFFKIIGNIAMEFGPAGILDGLILRPFFMYLFPIILSNFMLGILIGKFAGDFTFYILVILSYEINKWYKIKWSKN